MIRVLLPQIHHLLLSTPEIQPLLLGLLLQRYQMFLRGPSISPVLNAFRVTCKLTVSTQSYTLGPHCSSCYHWSHGGVYFYSTSGLVQPHTMTLVLHTRVGFQELQQVLWVRKDSPGCYLVPLGLPILFPALTILPMTKTLPHTLVFMIGLCLCVFVVCSSYFHWFGLDFK